MKHYFFSIKHAALKILLVLMLFLHATAYAAAPLKINGLGFDNSDNIIFIKSTGEINLIKEEDNINSNLNEITKGFLDSPKRAYVDITNAILTSTVKNYELKNSVFENVKISQFSTNPNIVRIVFTYKDENAQTGNFNAFANNKGIVIRYTKELNKTSKNFIIYSNTPDKERSVFFEGATSIAQSTTQDLKEYALQSKFYVNSLAQSTEGIMIKGTGFLSLKPSIYLSNPDRMVIDIDDALIAKNLRNKSYTIGITNPNQNETIKQREIIRLGQNTQNTVRAVIQGKDAKQYRAVISPDLQNIYIAKRSDVINSNITESKSTLKNIIRTIQNNTETLEFNFTSPVAFSIFEENNNLYLDFNNVQAIAEDAQKTLIEYQNSQTVRIALDKYSFVLPLKDENTGIQIKTSPDSKNLIAILKTKDKTEEPKVGTITKIPSKEKSPSISNLYKVVIDAGHGGSDVGATRAGIYEKNITLIIAKMVEKNLKAKGVQTTMTLDYDKTVSLQERCDISNETEPNLFVSVHVNSSVNDEIFGIETHWWKDDSKEYADTVHSHLRKKLNDWQTKDRGLFRSQFYVINHTTAPAILVEIGFISNVNERAALITQKRQTEIAKAISDGVMDYLKNKGQD